jgi:hypothetical protein
MYPINLIDQGCCIRSPYKTRDTRWMAWSTELQKDFFFFFFFLAFGVATLVSIQA